MFKYIDEINKEIFRLWYNCNTSIVGVQHQPIKFSINTN